MLWGRAALNMRQQVFPDICGTVKTVSHRCFLSFGSNYAGESSYS